MMIWFHDAMVDAPACGGAFTPARRRRAFTLIELLVVMGIMVLLLTIGVAGFQGIRRGAELRGAVNSVRTALMLARQQAITKRCKIEVKFVRTSGSTTNSIEVSSIQGGMTNLVHGRVVLSPAVEFSPVPESIIFTSAGGTDSAGGGIRYIVLREKVAGGMAQTNKVWLLTGVTKLE